VLIPPQDTVIYKGMEKTMYQFKVTALQPIFTWGKIPLAIDLSRISIQSKNLQREKKEREILTQISILTYSLGMLEKIQEILNLQQKVAVRLLEISSESYESGFLIYADFLDAKIKAKQIDVALAELAEQKNQLVLQLRYITGIEELSSNQILLPVELIMPENLPGPDKDHLISSAKRNNPDLKLLSLLREAQDLKVRLTKAKGLLKPDLGLHLELSYSGSRFPFLETDWYGQGRYNLTSSLGIKTSLYDGGVKKAQIMEESQNLESVLLQIQEGFAALEQFISKTILSLDYQRINLEYQKLRIENSQHQLDLKKTQFQSGSGMETDYLNSQIALYGNIAEYYRNAISYYINYAELANAAGFEDPVIPKGEIK